MYQNHYGQQLPFSSSNQEQPFLNISLNNPPVFINYQCQDQYLMSLTPTVTAALAIEIQNNAQRNPARMFMFNMYSRNNFANPEFESLVITTMDYIMLGLAKQAFVSPDQGMGPAVTDMTTMYCSEALRQIPGLDQYLDQQAINSARDSIAHLDQTRLQIGQMKQQMFGGAQSNMYGNNMQPAQWGGGNSRYNQPRSSHSGGRMQQQFPQQSNMTTASSSLFQSSNNVQNNASVSRHSRAFERPQPKPRQAEVVKQPIQQPFTPRTNTMQPITQGSNVREVLAKDSNVKWKPTKDKPYFLAYNPLESDLMYLVDNNNKFVNSVLREKVTSAMDYEQHVITTVFGNTPKSVIVDKNDLKTQLEFSINAINNPAFSSESTVPYIKEEVILEQCLDLAWFNGSICRIEANMPFIYRVHAIVTTPFVSEVDTSNLIVELSECSTYLELRRKLNTFKTKMSPELWAYIVKKLTNHVNRFIKQNLSIADLSIDSFMDDIEDLLTLLKDTYGKTVLDAFLRKQDDYITASLVLVDSKSIDDVTSSNFLGNVNNDDNHLHFDYINSEYSLTYVNCSSHELQLELSENSSSLVNSLVTPAIYELVKGIIEDSESRGNTVDRCLIRTNDLRTLECCRGAIDETCLMLTLIS